MISIKTVRDYTLKDKIGVGSYGTVFKATKKGDKQVYVIKIISIYNLSEKEREDVENEAKLLGSVNSPFVVKYYDSFVEETDLFIVMEYCDGGDLAKFLILCMKTGRTMPEEKIWKMFIQIALGLASIHNKKILHRDIKTLNLFLTKDDKVKIGDLGVAKSLTFTNYAKTFIGTPYYLSPEICEEKPYDEKSDVWALGCILYELATYKHPFNATSQPALILKIVKGKYEAISKEYSQELRKVLDMMLTKNVFKRPNIFEILSNTIVSNKAKEIKLYDAIVKELNQYNSSMSSLKSPANKNPVQAQGISEKKAITPVNSTPLIKKAERKSTENDSENENKKKNSGDINKLQQLQQLKSAKKKPVSYQNKAGVESKDLKKLFIKNPKNNSAVKLSRPVTAQVQQKRRVETLGNDDSVGDYNGGILDEFLQLNENAVKLTKELGFFNPEHKSTKFFLQDKMSVNEFFKKNMNEIENCLEMLNKIPSNELDRSRQEKKNELIKTKSTLENFFAKKKKTSSSNIGSKGDSPEFDSVHRKKQSSSSNVVVKERKATFKVIKPIEMPSISNSKDDTLKSKKSKSSLDLINVGNDELRKCSNSNFDRLKIPLTECKVEGNFKIEENLVKTIRHSLDYKRDEQEVEREKYNENVIDYEDFEEYENEVSYEEDNVQEVAISTNDHTDHNDHKLFEEFENNITLNINKIPSEETEKRIEELSNEIKKWTNIWEENKAKIVSMIGNQNFSKIYTFYIEKTNNKLSELIEEDIVQLTQDLKSYANENQECIEYLERLITADIVIDQNKKMIDELERDQY